MNVWVVNHYAVLPSDPGGTRHYALAKELVRRGCSVTVVASSFDHTTRREAHLRPGEGYTVEFVDGVRFLWLRTPPYSGNTLGRIWNMLAFGFRVWRGTGWGPIERPDVIVGSSPHLFAALAAERVAARLSVPFVLEVRDLWPQTFVDVGGYSRHHPFIALLERIERYLYRSARRIITLLPAAVDHVVEKGGDPAKVVWIPNGIDLDLVPQPSPPEDHVFTVMYAGAHGLVNGLDNVLAAAALLKNGEWQGRVRFRLVGDGPEKPSLMRRATDLGLDNVLFEEPVPKQEVYRVLQQANAFVVILKRIPLYRWGISPNKLFDFMASARPVILSGDSSFNPVGEAKAGVTVPPENPAALAEAVKFLVRMPAQERWQMGLRGRAYVERYHAFNHLAERLLEVLEDVVGENRAVARG